MASGLRRMPIKAEVGTADGEVGGNCQFLSATGADQGAVIPDAKA